MAARSIVGIRRLADTQPPGKHSSAKDGLAKARRLQPGKRPAIPKHRKGTAMDEGLKAIDLEQARDWATLYDHHKPTPAEQFDYDHWLARWLAAGDEEKDEGWPKQMTGVGPTIAA